MFEVEMKSNGSSLANRPPEIVQPTITTSFLDRHHTFSIPYRQNTMMHKPTNPIPSNLMPMNLRDEQGGSDLQIGHSVVQYMANTEKVKPVRKPPKPQ